MRGFLEQRLDLERPQRMEVDSTLQGIRRFLAH
ncbi:hypothetical protein PSEUDO8BK_30640 [Pseudomonas sp. 8BK]|nr:hypothetical protein PSEUDO8BK_30640 [Pseudomonas sp. 8BK]